MTTWVWSCGSSSRLGRLTEGGGDQAVSCRDTSAARSSGHGSSRPVARSSRSRLDGDVVALGEALVAGERPPHRHRLGCREASRRTPPRPCAPCRTSRPGRRTDTRAVSQRSGHGPTETPPTAPSSPHPTDQAGRPGGRSTGRLLTVGLGQIAGVVLRRRVRRRGVKGRHPKHEGPPQSARAPVCPCGVVDRNKVVCMVGLRFSRRA